MSNAPLITPVTGNYDLYCVGIAWSDGVNTPIASVNGAAHDTASIYRDLSRNLFTFDPHVRQINVPYPHELKHLAEAEHYCKQQINAQGNHIYVLVNHNLGSVSHGSGDTAHLLGTLTRDFCHEVGHCHPLNLAHSGAYKNGTYSPYGDGTSFMGKFASSKLTACQLYALGWLPNTEVALHDDHTVTATYALDRLFGGVGTLKAVMISRANKPLFLSRPTFKGGNVLFALHLQNGYGSQRIATFADNFEYEDLTFKRINVDGNLATVQIAPKT